MIRAVLSLAAFILLWWGLVAVFNVPAYLVPSPGELADKAWFLATEAGLLSHIPVTLVEIVAGFVIGVVAGVATAVLFTRLPAVEVVLNLENRLRAAPAE